ncbi:DUF1744-domain-containing protein [Polychaeton citri CBS 116435]|uniref:DNA polymerase epsilon catalytic subunit n=1 Tax=Polychaeton citri CBS 116435 TaxID=1314669 RepID=A0A9P4Q2E8_9PEZI|nr:DUF1744-domain-containing protein [Polychaeton citri CBS 116435]
MPVRRKDGPRRFQKGGHTGGLRTKSILSSDLRSSEQTAQHERTEATRLAHSVDVNQGFERFEAGKPRAGWLCNMHSTTVEDSKVPGGRAAVDYYFIGDEGETFKAAIEYEPYFLLAVKRGKDGEVEEWLKRSFEGLIRGFDRVDKEDLKMPNHLLGYRRKFLKLRFANVTDLLAVRRGIMPLAEKNREKVGAMDAYAEVASANAGFDMFDEDFQDQGRRTTSIRDASDYILDIREYDVPYHVRVSIDLGIRVGKWYTVSAIHGRVALSCLEDRLTRADPIVMAYDIETTKLPLKFPDNSIDQIMMISYMIDGMGFLITNRSIVSQDIEDFDYTPKPEFPGPFIIFNEPDEEGVIQRFFDCIKEARPNVIVTYNGDFFDWPFVEARASVHGIDMYREIGFRKNNDDVYQSTHCAHMDAFAWVNRDSYLPQGSRGLKAVTVAKLGYDPDELDPELMTPYANERPQVLAEYSVSDAVATYYLYMKYVHPFIFSLCTIIPLGPDDVLRKGTGTLCEMLLMVEAYQGEIILPNKYVSPRESFWEGHLLESETYVGGHVESIEAGVFRSDIPCNFAVDPSAIDELLDDLDAALKFTLTVEEKKDLDDVADYEEVKQQIADRLVKLKETPNRAERPLIYHLDVASMYPNIMTTNRLQPDSMIDESVCAACDFNRPGKTCDRRMPWSWRGEFLPSKRDEYNMIRHALENEKFPARNGRTVDGPGLLRSFQDLSLDEQAGLVKKRLQDYSKKIYHKIHDARTIEREAIICQRENPFYVDTVKNFRDRRYDFKGKQKVWKGKTSDLEKAGASASEIEEAKKMIILFDSLQLAHKVILNSFYGYVMRKGSRWYSMEMAGVTCLTGAKIIQMARQLVERIGRPLELDTDGIWCILPATFPENFTFKMKNGKKVTISYPCVMLNHLVHARFTNHQYQTLVDPNTYRYQTHSDNTIFFEVDGPYRAMVLPTSKEEDKNLKKRYAVFNHDGSLAELKGFEVKRRGELKLIKIFQQQIFKFFLEGTTLEETYASVAKVADKWLDVLDSKGDTLADEELIDLICENKSMAKTLEEYGTQKSSAITTAKRLAEFLGEAMIKDKGLNCKFIVSSRPRNAPVTERAIPVAIFSAEDSVKRYYLRKWLRDGELGDVVDPRNVIDWQYYAERLGSVVQKLVTIPAALQKVQNPVPRVPHPEWLESRLRRKADRFQQVKMTEFWKKREGLGEIDPNVIPTTTTSTQKKLGTDLEDFGGIGVTSSLPKPSGGKGARVLLPSQQHRQNSNQKRKARDGEDTVEKSLNPYDALPKEMPDMHADYKAWLQYQKQKWKIQKSARARRRQLFGEQRQDATDAIGTFFRNQAELIYSADWQILQLRETDNPGEVLAFVLIDKKVHRLRIMVPRQIFLNLKEEELPNVSVDGVDVEKVTNWTLPNGHPSRHLFKLRMSETVFVNEREKLQILFSHSSVEGVYETHVPLNVRAMLELGSVCTFDETQRGVLGKGLEQGFDLQTLKPVIKPKSPYLGWKKDDNAGARALGWMALYQISAGDRQVYALFSTTRPEVKIVVLNRGGRSEAGAGMPNLDRLYSELLTKKVEESEGKSWQDILSYQENLHFSTVIVTTLRRAYQELGDAVKKIQKEASGASLALVLQASAGSSSISTARLASDIPILKDFPILKLPADQIDSQLPPLGWQSVIAKRFITSYLDLGLWIEHLLSFAQYGNVPLGNLNGGDESSTEDAQRFVIDIAYARQLVKEKVVLWWSSGVRPDHAGFEKDEVGSVMEDAIAAMPRVCLPGCYSSVSVEICVEGLGVNAILAAAIAGEGVLGSGKDELMADGNDDTIGFAFKSEDAFAASGVRALREMVKSWWAEACAVAATSANSSTTAIPDILVQHLVRWLSTPSSHLYDSRLHAWFANSARQSFTHLLTEFRRVGSHVVFASASAGGNARLLLQTSKSQVGNAFAYCQYIMRTIVGKPEFNFLDLRVLEFWDWLVWLDEWDYGGRGCKGEIIGSVDMGEDGELPLETVMHWQMATYLPPALQPVFEEWVVNFIELMHQRKQEASGLLGNGGAGVMRSTQLPIHAPVFKSLTHAAEKHDQTIPSEVLTKGFSRPLQKQVTQLIRRQRTEAAIEELASDWVFPILAGSHPLQGEKGMQDPTLELVKMICQVLSLDKTLTLEARLLRKELLTQFEVREFSVEATFRNPSASLLVRGLICAECCAPRDLDLCKDSSLYVPTNSNSPPILAPICESCGAPFDRLMIEEKLIGEVGKMAVDWMSQDLKCVKCGGLKDNEFMTHCGCGGGWVETAKRGVLIDRLKVLDGVGKFFGLKMLSGVVEGAVAEL